MRWPGGWPSGLPSALPPAPCPRCGRRTPGLAWGELCPECAAVRVRRARKIAGRISLVATALMGLYLALRLPVEPIARTYAAIAVVATYLIVRRIVLRIALELLPK
ncbi:MAG TPA: hypothetical protein VNK43_04275 [Gemmatimonadales bacterium]|nr:hypothetical protein [Gemmatimonadales bacterium]